MARTYQPEILQRLTRIETLLEERNISAGDQSAQIVKLDARVQNIEKRLAWIAGVSAAVGAALTALAGWIAKAFTVTTGGK